MKSGRVARAVAATASRRTADAPAGSSCGAKVGIGRLGRRSQVPAPLQSAALPSPVLWLSSRKTPRHPPSQVISPNPGSPMGTMPAKRPGDDDVTPPLPAKASRTDLRIEYEGSASASARRKGRLESHRSGMRQMQGAKEDAATPSPPGGCSPCAQNNTECRTTDRITGLARSRGHTESLEGENANLRSHIESLQKQLREKGIDPVVQTPTASSAYAPTAAESYTPTEQSNASWGSLQHSERPKMQSSTLGDSTPSQPALLNEFRTGCIGDNYLGVSSGNSWLSPIEGTSLSLFGATLDLNEFIPEDRIDSGTSYQKFLDHAFIEQQKNAPPLPSWEQGKVYAEWYFRSIQPMLPILHKPHFMQLLHRVYNDDQFRPEPAELVMVHMVMSMVIFQYSTRNRTPQQDFSHYYYSLSLVPRLIKGHTVPDMQALALICAQLRAFPRPGACWMFTNTVLGLAIELGLHRSVTAWQGVTAQQDPHTIEMRKRIFWSLMLMHVPVSGKLGRPMPLRLEDFDIEIPEEAHDYLPEEAHFDEWRKCSFRAGKWGFVLLKVQMKVYSSIYSIGSTPASYDSNVKNLEAELRETVAKFPPALSGGPETKDQDRTSALFLQLGATGCQLLIHHPALCRSLSPKVMSDNIDACLEASNRMLSIATKLKVLNGLDTTVYWNMDFLASMFTMLFAYTERRDTLTMADLQRLRGSMKGWLDVMGFVGVLLGTGDRLHTALRNLVEWSLSHISQHLAKKTATAAVASSSATPPLIDKPQQQALKSNAYEATNEYSQEYAKSSTHEMSTIRTSQQIQAQAPPQSQPQSQPPPSQMQPMPQAHVHENGYSNSQTYSYADPQSSTVTTFASAPVQSFAAQSYAGEDMKPNIEAQLAAHAALAQQQPHPASQPASSGYMNVYQTPTGAYAAVDPAGPLAWRNFAENIVTGLHTSAPGMSDAGLTSYANMMIDPLGNTAKTGAYMYPNSASFGSMQLPAQDGADWPLIQY
ncbi:hypothetical protein Q7P37_004500 [Cladosporium fusiforme]